MTIRVIGAGFGRTGTTSLKAALEKLGYGPCYHMIELMRKPQDSQFWMDVLAGKPVDWHHFFADYGATVDWPACTFYKELMEVYPEAKVLLSVRDPERWYDSTYNTIYRLPESPLMSVVRLFVPHIRRMYHFVNGLIWQGTFHGRFADREAAIAVFNRHNADVQQYVPQDRLLVYNVKEGWEPLCEFLGVPVPEDEPFPHLNDTATMRRVLRAGTGLLVALAVGVPLLIAWLAQRRSRR